jgi:hypothetical protein
VATVKVTSGVEGAASYLTEAGLAGGGQAQGSKTDQFIHRPEYNKFRNSGSGRWGRRRPNPKEWHNIQLRRADLRTRLYSLSVVSF